MLRWSDDGVSTARCRNFILAVHDIGHKYLWFVEFEHYCGIDSGYSLTRSDAQIAAEAALQSFLSETLGELVCENA
jgi:hypothetical protein